MKRAYNILVLVLMSLLLGGCSSSLYTSTLGYSDDMYSTPDYKKFVDNVKQKQAERAKEEQQKAEQKLAEFKAMAEAQGVKYNEVESLSEVDLGHIATSYESAYAHRLKGASSLSYKMPSSYYNLRYSSDFQFLTAYDPMVYNVVVMGDEVWVEPKYISSMFGTWGAPSYSTAPYWGPYYSSFYGNWGYNPYYWSHYPYDYYMWWGYPYYGWYDPWYYPPMWGPGFYPGYHPGHHPGYNPAPGNKPSGNNYPNYRPRPGAGASGNYRGLESGSRPGSTSNLRPGTGGKSRFDFTPRPTTGSSRVGNSSNINRPSNGRENDRFSNQNNTINRPSNNNSNRNTGYNNSNSSNYRPSGGGGFNSGGGFTGGGSPRSGGGGNYRGR